MEHPTNMTLQMRRPCSAGTHRKHYFRQLRDESWTPWAEATIDCEDMPITPILWTGRLFLFWLKVLKRNPPQIMSMPTGGNLGNADLSQLQANVQTAVSQNQTVQVQGVLYWSEFYNGKWQPTKSSDVNRPTSLAVSEATAFDANRNLWRIDPAIRLTGIPSTSLPLVISSTLTPDSGGFLLHNSHSLPVRFADAQLQTTPMPPGSRLRGLIPILPYTGGRLQDSFAIEYAFYSADGSVQTFTNTVLGLAEVPRYVDATEAATLPLNFWTSPFFFEDRRNVFYVTTTVIPRTLPSSRDFGILSTTPRALEHVPKIMPLAPQRTDTIAKRPIQNGTISRGGEPIAGELPIIGVLTRPAPARSSRP